MDHLFLPQSDLNSAKLFDISSTTNHGLCKVGSKRAERFYRYERIYLKRLSNKSIHLEP